MEDVQTENTETQSFDKMMKAYMIMLSVVSIYNLYDTTLFGRYRILKALMGGVMIISEVILFILALQAYRQNGVKNGLSHFVIWCAIIYNVGHILYAAIWEEDVAYLSLFGNPEFQPAFLLPFMALVGLAPDNVRSVFKTQLYYVLMTIPIFLLLGHVNVFLGMGLLFFLSFLRFLPRKWRVFFLFFAFIYVIYCYYEDARLPIIRTLMGLAIFVFSLTKLCMSKIVKIVVFVMAISVPIYFLMLFVSTGYSVFEQSSATEQVSQIGAQKSGDTRTFLYEEIFDDLTDNDAWILGKGINGTYYSPFFDQKHIDSDAADRKLAEVGFLDYLLKGGLVQAILYSLLLILAIYYCYFHSNSRSMVLIGSILITHYVLLFVEDVPRYDLYNFAMWFCIGMAFSPALLEHDDEFFQDQFDLIFRKA